MPEKTRPYELKQVEARVYLGQAGALYSKVPVTTPDAAIEVIREAMSQYDREYFSMLSLNNKNEVLCYSVVSIGSSNEAIVQTSKVFLPAILSGGVNIIAFHCHPSGDVSPSEADRSVTRNLIEAGRILDIHLLDHMIIGGGTGDYYSFHAHEPEMFEQSNRILVAETGAEGTGAYSVETSKPVGESGRSVYEADPISDDSLEIDLSSEPFYQHSFSYAMEHDEIPAWRASYHEDKRLKHMLEDLVRENYDGRRLGTDKIIGALKMEFSKERINALVAFTVDYLSYDGRLTNHVKAWAEKNCPEADNNVFGRDPRTDLLINIHPGLLNLLTEQIIRKEKVLEEYRHSEEEQKDKEEPEKKGRQQTNESVSKKSARALLLAAFIIFSLLSAARVQAAGSLKQTDATKHSAVISFSGGSSGISVFISTSPNGMYSDWTRNSSISYGRAEISGLMDGSTYYVKLREGGRMSAACEIVTVPSGSIAMIKQTDAAKNSISIRWNTVSHANGYTVELIGAGERILADKYASRNTVTIKVPDHKNKYAVRITPVRKGKSYTAAGTAFTGKRNMMAVPGKMSDVSFKKNRLARHKAAFIWNSNSAVSGYEYEVRSHDGIKLFSGTAKKAAVTLKNRMLKMNRYYRIRVRGYVNTENGPRYGKWSKKAFFSGGPAKVTLKQSSGTLSVRWSKVDGATSYSVYVATSAPRKLSAMKKAKTVAGTNCTITKFAGTMISSGGIYYVTVVSNRKVGKKNYRSKPTTYYYIG